MKRAGVGKRKSMPFLTVAAILALLFFGLVITGFVTLQANSDLRPVSLEYSPFGPQVGDSVTFTATVMNIGSGSSDTSFIVSLFVDGINVANDTVSVLGASSQGDATFSWTATSGLHDVYVVVDPDNTVSELDENNNIMKRMASVEWSMYQQNPQRLGYANISNYPRTYTDFWVKTVGSTAESHPNIMNGVIYFARTDRAFAYNLTTGDQIWNRSIGSGYTPGGSVIYDGVMYIGSSNARLYALNASTEEMTDAQRLIFNYTANDDIQVSPIVANGMVFFNTYSGKAYAINASSASMTDQERYIWNFSFSSHGREMAYDHEYDMLFFGNAAGNDRLYAINASAESMTNTERLVWNASLGDDIFGTPVVYKGMVLITVGYALDTTVYAFNKTTGVEIWRYSQGTSGCGSCYPGIAVWNDTIYAANSNDIYALDPDTGSVVWNITESNCNNIRQPLTAANGALFVPCLRDLYVHNAVTGAVLWNKSFPGDNINTAPSLGKGSSGWVVFGTVQKLYAFEGKPDLNVTSISYAPGTPYHGDSVEINTTVKELGSGADAFNVTLYIDNVPQSTQRVNGLSYSEETLLTFTWAAQYGSHTIKISADSGNELDESDESNNNRTQAISVLRKVYAISPANGTIVDRNGVNDTYDDYIILQANVSDGSTGTSVTFYANRTQPSQYASTYINLGSNNTVNGIAILNYTPNTATDYAGRYVWWPTATGATPISSRYFDIYGGLNVSFKNNDTNPNSSYESGDNVTAEVLLSALSPETHDDLVSVYNAAITVTLTPPTQSPITFDINNTSSTAVSTLATGTAVSECDIGGAGDFVDFSEDLVPSPVPVGPWCGGPALSGYTFTWTCDAATCPGESGNSYTISDSDDAGVTGCGGSWNSLDFFELTGFDITAACPSSNVNGWTFDVTGQQTTYFWSGSTTLQTEGGSWSASAGASADWFFSGSASRGFSVAGEAAAAPAAPSAGVPPGRAITIDAEDDLISEEDDMNKITIDRGTSEPITILVENTGDFVVTDIIIEAIGLPPGWVSITPSKIDSLGQNEIVEVQAVISIPETAGLGDYDLTFEAHSYYVKVTYAALLTVTDKCGPCPVPGEWSECIDGKHSRTNYRCGAQTDYKCEEWTEERGCVPLPKEVVDNAPLLLMIIIIGMVVIGRFYWKK